MEGLPDCYLFRLNDEFDVDATTCGNAARFINHCCDPNLETTVVTYRSQNHIVFRARRDISVGDEITYDYKFEIEDDENRIACTCGASSCRGRIN